MKFDVIVGNPPYQSNKSSLNLWPLFIEKGFELLNENGYLAYISPNTWMRPSTDIKRTKEMGGSKFIFKDFMQVYNTKYIDTVSPVKYFNVGSTIGFYIICKEPYAGFTNVVCEDGEITLNLSKFILLPHGANKITLSIFEKLQQYPDRFKFKGIRNDLRAHLNYTLAPTTENKYMYIGSQYNKKNFNNDYEAMVYYTSEKHPDHDIPKIIINYIGDIKPYVDNGNSGMQYCQVHYLNNIDEVAPAKSIIKSNIFKFAYKFVRYGMHNEAGVLNAFSKPPLSKQWSNTELYEYFNLTQEEIDYIEANVK
jgi:hypothetical protein